MFLTNPSFRLVESEFLFSGKSIPLARMKDFLETSFPLDDKKNYHWQESLKNREKNGFH